MTNTLIGVAEIIAGLLMAVLSGPLASATTKLNRRTLGVEFPAEWLRAVNVFIGGLLSFSGLLTLLGWPHI